MDWHASGHTCTAQQSQECRWRSCRCVQQVHLLPFCSMLCWAVPPALGFGCMAADASVRTGTAVSCTSHPMPPTAHLQVYRCSSVCYHRRSALCCGQQPHPAPDASCLCQKGSWLRTCCAFDDFTCSRVTRRIFLLFLAYRMKVMAPLCWPGMATVCPSHACMQDTLAAICRSLAWKVMAQMRTCT